jgi:excisionase family DNA binding protein
MDARQQEVLSLEELATFLKVPKSTVYALLKQRRIPRQKVGRYWRFWKKAFERWLEDPPPLAFADSGNEAGIHH